ALILWAVAAVTGILRRHAPGLLPPLLVGTGSGLALTAAVVGGDRTLSLPLPWFLGVAPIQLAADPLSRWFLGIIGFVGVAVALFSPGYLRHLRRRVAVGFVWAGLAALMASMALVVLAGNAILFLVAWEAMA